MTDPEPILDELRERLRDSTFHRSMGIEVIDAVAGEVTLAVDVTSDQRNLQGLVHGGVLATLGDTAMGLAVRTAVEPGTGHVTIELGVHFLRPGRPGRLAAVGRAIRVGRRVAFAEADVLDADGVLLARASGTYAVARADD